jgi:hypothetical protein
MAKRRKPDNPDQVIFSVLVYEFRADEHGKSEATIRRRLRYHGLGPYDQERVELLRRLKDSLRVEIGRHQHSRYYLEPHGEYAAMEDFDVPRLVDDCCAEFLEVARADIESFVQFAVFTYYLR